ARHFGGVGIPTFLRRAAAGAAIGEARTCCSVPAGIAREIYRGNGAESMKLDIARLGVVLKSRGLHMSRSKYQRPEVYLWAGKSGEKFWKAEWRVYIEGRPKPKHRAQTWPCSRYTKAQAQEGSD